MVFYIFAVGHFNLDLKVLPIEFGKKTIMTPHLDILHSGPRVVDHFLLPIMPCCIELLRIPDVHQPYSTIQASLLATPSIWNCCPHLTWWLFSIQCFVLKCYLPRASPSDHQLKYPSHDWSLGWSSSVYDSLKIPFC